MIYTIEAKPKINTNNEDKQCNMDWEWIRNYKRKDSAIKFAKNESKKSKWYEVHVNWYNTDEDINNSIYFRGGKIEWHISG